MDTMIDDLRETEQNEIAEEGASQASAWAEYRAILERFEAPDETDADRLAELTKELGLDSRHVQVHLVVLEEAGTFEGIIKAAADAQTLVPKAKATIRDLISKQARISEQINEQHETLRDAEAKEQHVPDARHRLTDLKRLFGGLLTGDESFEADKEPHFFPYAASAAVEAKQREVGLEAVRTKALVDQPPRPAAGSLSRRRRLSDSWKE